MGEKEYVRKFTIRKKNQQEKNVSVSSELLRIAIDRYPELLPEFYAIMIKSSSPSWPLSEPLAKHREIPLEVKRKHLLKGISSGGKEHRNYALWGLMEIDPQQAEGILLKLIVQCPKTTRDEYWTDENARMSHFVAKSTNPKIWQTASTLIKRVDLGMRMEFISHLRPAKKCSPCHLPNLLQDIRCLCP